MGVIDREALLKSIHKRDCELTRKGLTLTAKDVIGLIQAAESVDGELITNFHWEYRGNSKAKMHEEENDVD